MAELIPNLADRWPAAPDWASARIEGAGFTVRSVAGLRQLLVSGDFDAWNRASGLTGQGAGALALTQARLPVGTEEARDWGLIDGSFGASVAEFRSGLETFASELAASPDLERRLSAKRLSRLADEAEKPLAQYRAEELEHMKLNFYGFDPSYHVARWNFIGKVPKSRTPLYLARHRSKAPTP